jgi:hypothetical protein
MSGCYRQKQFSVGTGPRLWGIAFQHENLLDALTAVVALNVNQKVDRIADAWLCPTLLCERKGPSDGDELRLEAFVRLAFVPERRTS